MNAPEAADVAAGDGIGQGVKAELADDMIVVPAPLLAAIGATEGDTLAIACDPGAPGASRVAVGPAPDRLCPHGGACCARWAAAELAAATAEYFGVAAAPRAAAVAEILRGALVALRAADDAAAEEDGAVDLGAGAERELAAYVSAATCARVPVSVGQYVPLRMPGGAAACGVVVATLPRGCVVVGPDTALEWR